MAELTRRLQVLLDEPRWTRLERQARRRGTSVATLVREAIDLAFPSVESTAADSLADERRDRGPTSAGLPLKSGPPWLVQQYPADGRVNSAIGKH